MAFDKPGHGWEGNGNGGEIYGSSSSNNKTGSIREQYLSTVNRLALQKIKNNIIFDGQLDAVVRKFLSMGMSTTKDSLLKDIQAEIYRQQTYYGQEENDFQQEIFDSINGEKQEKETQVQNQTEIELLKSQLASIFESTPTKEQKPQSETSTIPREPAMQSPKEMYAQAVQPPQAEAEQQPKALTNNFISLSDDAKQRIISIMESRGEVLISSIDNVYQEGKYIVVDAKDNHGRFTGAEFMLQDFFRLINNDLAKSEGTEEIINEQSTGEKREQIINQIIGNMLNTGAFANSGIDITSKMKDIQYEKLKLGGKTYEELQIILSTYQNTQEENTSDEMHI